MRMLMCNLPELRLQGFGLPSNVYFNKSVEPDKQEKNPVSQTVPSDNVNYSGQEVFPWQLNITFKNLDGIDSPNGTNNFFGLNIPAWDPGVFQTPASNPLSAISVPAFSQSFITQNSVTNPVQTSSSNFGVPGLNWTAGLTKSGKDAVDISNTESSVNARLGDFPLLLNQGSPYGTGSPINSLFPLFCLFPGGGFISNFFLNSFFDEVNKMTAQNEIKTLAGQDALNALQTTMKDYSISEDKRATAFFNFYERFIENAKSPILKILQEKAIEEHKAEAMAEKAREEKLGFVLTSARRNYISAVTGLKPEDIDPAVLRAIVERLLERH